MDSILNNKSIDIDQLAPIGELIFKPLDPKYRLYLYLINSLWFVAFSLGAALFYYFDEGENIAPAWLGTAGLINLIIYCTNLILIFYGFRLKQYSLKTYDITYKSGLIYRKETSIPLKRIQHVEIKQNPLFRKMDLAQMVFYTAGGSSGDLNIPGIPLETALQLKQEVSLNIGKNE